LKLSPSPFCHGEPGSMDSVSISVAFRNCLSFIAMNSEPWSLRNPERR
jgi:hypothetical protein